MKEFLRSTLATITGVLICGFIFIILGVTMLAGIVASSESETLVMPNSVFTLELKGTVQERYQPSPRRPVLLKTRFLHTDWKIF